MRDYALSRAESLGEIGISWLASYRNWKTRTRVARLEHYDDFLLADIGVTRDEVRWAATLPLNVNAALALEDRAFRRRKGEPARRAGWGPTDALLDRPMISFAMLSSAGRVSPSHLSRSINEIPPSLATVPTDARHWRDWVDRRIDAPSRPTRRAPSTLAGLSSMNQESPGLTPSRSSRRV